MKGINLIAGVIFLALTITAAAIIYEAGVPAVQQLQAKAAVEKMKTTLLDLDTVIREVAAEGQGSKRTVFISPDPGTLTVNGSTDSIKWELETSAPVVSPRSSTRFGSLIVGSNLETSVTEGYYTRVSPQVPAYVMENSHLRAYVRKLDAPQSLSTHEILLAVYSKDLGTWLESPGFLDISVDSDDDSKSGTCYTRAQETGNELPSGKVTAYMSTSHLDYNIHFILESSADFLIIEGEA